MATRRREPATHLLEEERHPNQAENFFSQLKRSLDGTHHHVSAKHLPRYLAEFDFRHSTRAMSDTDRMARMVRQTNGIRLAYRPLVGA